MKILKFVKDDFWHEVASKCPWATYFHAPGWARLIEKTFSEYAVASQGFVMDSGASVVLPAVLRTRQGIFKKKQYKSMEPGVYGGPVADRDLSQEEINQIARHLLKMKKATGRIVESPYKQLGLSPLFKSKSLTTHVVSLDADYDAMSKKFSRGQKSNIKQAKKKMWLFVRRKQQMI